jgi:hypothetical protein
MARLACLVIDETGSRLLHTRDAQEFMDVLDAA